MTGEINLSCLIEFSMKECVLNHGLTDVELSRGDNAGDRCEIIRKCCEVGIDGIVTHIRPIKDAIPFKEVRSGGNRLWRLPSTVGDSIPCRSNDIVIKDKPVPLTGNLHLVDRLSSSSVMKDECPGLILVHVLKVFTERDIKVFFGVTQCCSCVGI